MPALNVPQYISSMAPPPTLSIHRRGRGTFKYTSSPTASISIHGFASPASDEDSLSLGPSPSVSPKVKTPHAFTHAQDPISDRSRAKHVIFNRPEDKGTIQNPIRNGNAWVALSKRWRRPSEQTRPRGSGAEKLQGLPVRRMRVVSRGLLKLTFCGTLQNASSDRGQGTSVVGICLEVTVLSQTLIKLSMSDF
ncbi:hypothetical protein K458DRAFT_400770 [Lentithecium fluviatile CBS 122367]|uniref:Uncharacterized protein n=1 Tax=Lentithecium fluviatile CBS 122367 TaxID=1168545 RepID=A0A6G1JDH1_9PLEO|nr:hypothetical protein K458DRAFT_400770 [Lentithecium fluviatile CBS 122367]